MSVKSTIDFYLAEESPGYALQITGEWGAGKTHAVKKYCKMICITSVYSTYKALMRFILQFFI